MRHAHRVIATVLVGLVIGAGGATSASAASSPSTDSTVTYSASSANIANPERGFYKHTETHYYADGSGYTPLDPATLAGYRDQGITQILRVFYLEKFAGTDRIDPAYLRLVEKDLKTARSAGISVIVRFAYALPKDEWPYAPPYGDAPLSRVKKHIQQLKPVFHAYADVIALVQEGFIGLWGEGYYTDYFVADPAHPETVTETDWKNRSAVLKALLDAVPKKRMVATRTMFYKQQFLGTGSGATNALTPAQGFSGSDQARVGHHNDCFLASPDDFGTFLSDPITLDQEYLEADSRYLPVGGETCAVNSPRSDWASASAEMARYHYSYLNRDYNTDVLNTWGASGIAETANRLGYRFVLTKSTVTSGQKTASVALSVRNDGWAAPYNPRTARLVLKDQKHTYVINFAGNADVQRWAAGTTVNLTGKVKSVPAGTYRAYLSIPSNDAATRNDPRFAIQTANQGTWNATTGLNDLRQKVTIH